MIATRATLFAILAIGLLPIVSQISPAAFAQTVTPEVLTQDLPLLVEEDEVLSEAEIRLALEEVHPFLSGMAWEDVRSGEDMVLPILHERFLPDDFIPGAPQFTLTGAALAIAKRDTRILAGQFHVLDSAIVLVDVTLSNLAGEARAETIVLAPDTIRHLGDFLTAEPETRIYPARAGFVTALDLRIDTREIVREDRPGPVFKSMMQTEGLLVEGLHVRFPDDPRDRVDNAAADDAGEGGDEEAAGNADEAESEAAESGTADGGTKRLLVERILGGATRGEAVFAGEASFSFAHFEGVVTGSIDALSPRRLLAHLEQEPARFAAQPAAEGRIEVDVSDAVMQVTGRRDSASPAASPAPVELLIGEAGFSVAVESNGVVTLTADVGAAEATPQIFAGTPLEGPAMRVAVSARASADRLFGEGRAYARLAPGYDLDFDLWLDVPGLLTLRNAADVDLPDNLRASLRGGRMAALLPLIFESTARQLTFAMIDGGLGALVEAETERSLREWVADAVVAEAPTGGGGGMEAMTLQLALGQLEGVFVMLEDEGSVRLEAVSERPASLVLQALEFLRSARPVAEKDEIRP